MKILNQIKKDLRQEADKEKAKFLMRFFKTGEGQYGAGDKFLGIMVPKQRQIAKKYFTQITITQTLALLRSKFHEERLTALFILMFKYKLAEKIKNEKEKTEIFKSYLANTKFIDNWDLVDVTCRDIVGAYLFKKDKSILYKLARSKNLWQKRIAIISTFYFIARNDLDDTYQIAELLLGDRHDLIHKAVGWALREAGKKDKARLAKFLNRKISHMPRTTLRYAIEKFPEGERKKFLSTPPLCKMQI